MADLTYDFATLKNAALHAAAKDSFPSGDSVGSVVNSALNYLARCHPWEWRTKFTTLDTATGVATISLPSDFGELVHVWGKTAPYDTKRLRPVNHWELPIIRQQATAIAANAVAATAVFYTITGKAQASVTVAGLYQFELHPTPASTVVSALSLVYRRLPPVLSADTDKPDVPTDFQDLLLQLVRAFACTREKIDLAAPEWQIAKDMIDVQKGVNDRVHNPALPRLTNVIDDYFDVGKVRVAWS